MNRVDEVFQGSQGNVLVHSGNYGLIQSHRGRKLYLHDGENDLSSMEDIFKLQKMYTIKEKEEEIEKELKKMGYIS